MKTFPSVPAGPVPFLTGRQWMARNMEAPSSVTLPPHPPPKRAPAPNFKPSSSSAARTNKTSTTWECEVCGLEVELMIQIVLLSIDPYGVNT